MEHRKVEYFSSQEDGKAYKFIQVNRQGIRKGFYDMKE